MQMLVEGLAMGAFATFYNQINDPLGKKLMQLVMTDEAFHHKFGKIWADRTIPNLTPGGARDHRGLGRPLLPDPAVQPGRPAPAAATSTREFGLDPDKVMPRWPKIMTDETCVART